MIKRIDRSNKREMRLMYSSTLIELMKENPNIVVLDADLVNASGTKKVFETYPNQTINMGIAEANMMSVAGGLSLSGKIPYVHTFAPFATRRAYDQIFLSGAYQRANFRIVGTDPGYLAGHNGGTHTSIEDLALMRVIPTMNVLIPADATSLEWMIRYTEKAYGMFYIRMGRKDYVDIYDENATFELGKANLVKEGNDGVIFAIGEMVVEAIEAAEIIKHEYDIDVAVVDIFSLKPLDKEGIVNYSKNKKFVITAENHSIINGLASAVSEVLVELSNHPPMSKVGIPDRFGEVGSINYLMNEYEVSLNHIIEAIKEFI